MCIGTIKFHKSRYYLFVFSIISVLVEICTKSKELNSVCAHNHFHNLVWQGFGETRRETRHFIYNGDQNKQKTFQNPGSKFWQTLLKFKTASDYEHVSVSGSAGYKLRLDDVVNISPCQLNSTRTKNSIAQNMQLLQGERDPAGDRPKTLLLVLIHQFLKRFPKTSQLDRSLYCRYYVLRTFQ